MIERKIDNEQLLESCNYLCELFSNEKNRETVKSFTLEQYAFLTGNEDLLKEATGVFAIFGKYKNQINQIDNAQLNNAVEKRDLKLSKKGWKPIKKVTDEMLKNLYKKYDWFGGIGIGGPQNIESIGWDVLKKVKVTIGGRDYLMRVQSSRADATNNEGNAVALFPVYQKPNGTITLGVVGIALNKKMFNK